MSEFSKNLDQSLDLTKKLYENILERQKWREMNLPYLRNISHIKTKVFKELNYLLYYSFTNKNTKKLISKDLETNDKKIKEVDRYQNHTITDSENGIHEPYANGIDYDNVIKIDKEEQAIYIGKEYGLGKKIIKNITLELVDHNTITKIYLKHQPWKDNAMNTFLDFVDVYRRIPTKSRYESLEITKKINNKTHELTLHDDNTFTLLENDTRTRTIFSEDIFGNNLAFSNDLYEQNELFTNIATDDKLTYAYKNVKEMESLLLSFNDTIKQIIDQYENLYNKIYEITQPYRVLDGLKKK